MQALQEERTQSMRSLQVHMGQLAQENAKLQMKLKRLEHSKMEAIATPSGQSRHRLSLTPLAGHPWAGWKAHIAIEKAS